MAALFEFVANVQDSVGIRAIPLRNQEIAVTPSPGGRDLARYEIVWV